jgi:hypothetical protein
MRKIGWAGAIRRSSLLGEVASTPSKNWPTSRWGAKLGSPANWAFGAPGSVLIYMGDRPQQRAIRRFATSEHVRGESVGPRCEDLELQVGPNFGTPHGRTRRRSRRLGRPAPGGQGNQKDLQFHEAPEPSHARGLSRTRAASSSSPCEPFRVRVVRAAQIRESADALQRSQSEYGCCAKHGSRLERTSIEKAAGRTHRTSSRRSGRKRHRLDEGQLGPAKAGPTS